MIIFNYNDCSKTQNARRKPVGEVFLETKELTKVFGEVTAVDGVSLEVRLGEIRGLIGENGSGKSTITSMISGIYPITSGEIYIFGKRYKPHSILDARKNGIAMIVQDGGTVDNISIADNVFLGDERRFAKAGVINRAKMYEECRKALAAVGLDELNPAASINTCNFETRKLIEIGKALYYDPVLFIVDETTTALSQDGRELIHRIMDDLKAKGKAVLFISHDLPELMQTCDCLTVLRDGKLIATMGKDEFSESKIKQTMVGRRIEGNYYRDDYFDDRATDIALEAVNVTTERLSDINMSVRNGEIVGVCGLSDSGMHDLGKLLFGMIKRQSGEVNAYAKRQLTLKEKYALHKSRLRKKSVPVEINEKQKYSVDSIRKAIQARIGYIGKDRDKETLILPETIRENLCISATDELNVFGIITPGKEKEFAKSQIDFLRIKCSSMNQLVSELSGGNKQKVSFGKWIGNKSEILVFDSPTRGVDVGVKTAMYQLLYELRNKNYAILIISEEMSEVIGMSDRIYVMKDGKITKEFSRNPELRDTDIVEYMV